MNWTTLRERLLGENIKDIRPPKLSIPPLPAVAMEFCRAAENPNLSIGDLASILDRDGALVVDLLRTINSSSTGVRNKVSSTKTALGLLGPRRAKMFVLTSSVQTASQKVKSKFATATAFSYVAMQRAIFARRLADRLGFDSDLCFSAALLQDYTIPALTVEKEARYKSLLSVLTEDVPAITILEQARFGWDHALAGARLMLSWNFPDELVCLQHAHHWLDPVLASATFSNSEMVVVALSALLPDPLDSRSHRIELLEHLLTTRYGIEIGPFQESMLQDLANAGIPTEPSFSWTSHLQSDALESSLVASH